MEDKCPVRVVIPAYNAARTIARCLEALFSSTCAGFEVVVVDDGSTDNTTDIAGGFPVKVIKNNRAKGAAGARNAGAAGCGKRYLLFLDSDVYVQPETLKRLVDTAGRENVDAVIGTYTRLPASRSPYSIYHNLFQYFYFFKNTDDQSKRHITSIFWSGLGMVTTEAFLGVGGYREARKFASSEDDYLGYDLTRKEFRIYLDMGTTVYHDHHYSFAKLSKNYFTRAKENVQAMFVDRPDDFSQGYLNPWNLAALVFSCLSLASFFLALLLGGAFTAAFVVFTTLFIAVNIPFLSLILKEKGVMFSLFSAVMSYTNYIIAGAGSASGLALELYSLVSKGRTDGEE